MQSPRPDRVRGNGPDPSGGGVTELDLAARYGTDRPRTGARALAVAAIVVFVAIIGYVTWRLGSPSVQANLIRFTVVSDDRVPTSCSTCTARARTRPRA